MATIQYVVNAVDAASATFARIAGSADEVLHKLDDIGRTTATARVALAGDKEATLTIDKLELKMAALAKKTAEGKIGVEGQARALLQIQALNLELDKLAAKHVTATVDVKVNRRSLRGLIGSLPAIGAGAEGAPGAGGLLSGGLTGSPLGIGAIAGGGLIGAGLVPAAVGAGIGGLTGLGAIGGGLFGAAQGKKVLTADQASIKMITTGLKTAIGTQKTILSQALKDANKKYAKDAAFFQPFTAFQASITHLMQTVIAPLRAIMGPLAGIFNQFGKGLTGLGPQFTALFRASLPFIKQFLGFMLQAGKILLPAFTTAMTEMVKSGALTQITQALVVLTQGFADFIVALGPGMAASAKIFARVVTFIAGALGPIGTAFSKVAEFLTSDWSPGHLWNILLASAKAFFRAVISSAKVFWHDVVSVFNSLRTGIAGVWSTIWTNTKNAVKTGINTVIGFFKTIPGRAVAALFGLGHGLAAFASSAFNEMWNAIKNVAGNIWNWLTGWVQRLPGWLKHLLGIRSPSSVFYDIGKQMMMGLFHGIKDHVHHARNAAQSAAGGAPGFGVAPNGPVQQYARQLLNAYGWGSQWPQFNALVMAESGWRWNATNPSSGAYGIPQALPPGKMGSAGRDWLTNPYTQLRWMMGYIHDRWTNPAGAWANEVANHWYGGGLSGGIFNRPTLIGVGERGPERVDVTPVGSRRRGDGPLLVIENLHVREAADVDLLARRLAFLDA